MAIQKIGQFIGNNKVVESTSQRPTVDTEKLASSGYISSTAGKLKDVFVDTYKSSKEMLDKGSQQIKEGAGKSGALAEGIAVTGRTAVDTTAKIAEGVGGVINAFVPDWLNQLVQKGSSAFEEIGTKIGEQNPELATKVKAIATEIDNSPLMTTLVQKTKENPDLLPVLSDAINTVLLGVGFEKGAPKARSAVTTVKETIPVAKDTIVQGAKEAFGKVKETVVDTTGKIKEKISTTKTPEEIAGEIAQGTKREAQQLLQAVPDIDVSKVKTAGDLKNQAKESIKKLVNEQDVEFNTNPNKYKLNQLVLEETVGNTKVVHNYVKDALEQLSELYTKINDPVSKAKVEQLQAKVDTIKGEGLTAKEVNDIARMHSSEFGSKAFGKTGEPLTSVNAQAFENTRKGIKETARDKMPNEKTKALDDRISNLYKVESLSTKLEKSVNKLAQKMTKPNMLQKISLLLGKAMDITGVKSFLKKSFDIGAQETTLSPIELEARLSDNLKKIEDALKKSDSELIKVFSESSK